MEVGGVCRACQYRHRRLILRNFSVLTFQR
jgi:hypothetical protein